MIPFKHLALAGTVLLLSACSSSSIKTTHQSLSLHNDDKLIHTSTKLLDKKFVNLSTIYINQEILRIEEGDIITYESVRIQRPYRIKNTYKRALGLIFNAQNVTKINGSNGLDYFKLRLRDERELHLIIKSSSKKQFAMVYGTNACLFKNAMAALDSDNSALVNCQHKQKQYSQDAIHSKWQPKLIILDSLLEMEPGIGAK